MLSYVVLVLTLVYVGVRWWMRRHGAPTDTAARRGRVQVPELVHGDVALVAAREIRERTRGRVFRLGTIVILLAVAAGVIIPTIKGKSSPSVERVGVVGTLPAPVRDSIVTLGPRLGTTVVLSAEPDLATARAHLDRGTLDLVLAGTSSVIVRTEPSGTSSSTTSDLAKAVALSVGLQNNLRAAGLSAGQAASLTHSKPLDITALHPAKQARPGQAVTVYGLILLFVLLSQYGTWILMGVVEEKSSRVVEVLLATLRPRQLLTGKVLGIGLVALLQAAAILAVALGAGAAVGSVLLKGSNPTNLLSTVLWLVLGYVFSCWLYAAAGSLATRQEHVQTLAFPLQLPLLVGYITSLTAVSGGSAGAFVHVLAYIPPMSAFAMPALVALGAVSWWQFLVSVVITLAATAGLSRLATTIYVRAILRTGQRVRLREVFSRSS